MQRKIFILIKYILVIIAGVIIYEVCWKGYAHIRFNRELKALQTSHDYDELYRIQSMFLHTPASNQIAYAVIGQCGIVGTPEAKLAGLDAIVNNNITFEPAFSLDGAIVHAPYEGVYDETKDTLKEVRTQALQT